MSQPRTLKISALLFVTIAAFSVPIISLNFGNSPARVEKEHGLRLPLSAKNLECAGDAWMVLDRCAYATFEMDRSDLSPFTAQLIEQPGAKSPTDYKPRDMKAPWTKHAPLSDQVYKSPTGDFLVVQTFALEDSRIGVWLFTDWN
jgi:hypothetical protein